MEDLSDIYNDLIMEHSINSYNKKDMQDATFSEKGHNPNCGDEITLKLKLDGDIIEEMTFTGHGCAISQASTSIMIDTMKRKIYKRCTRYYKDIFKYDKKGRNR